MEHRTVVSVAVQDESLRARIAEIAQDVAMRLRSPEQIREQMQRMAQESEPEFVKSHYRWEEADLCSGFAGLCLLFGELDRQEPDAGWDAHGHAMLVAVQQAMQKEGVRSLAAGGGGVAGVGMAARALSRGGTRYQNLGKQLHQFLLAHGRTFLDAARGNVQRGVMMTDYDAVAGWAGIGRYLLLNAEVPGFRELLGEALEYLVSLCEEKEVNGTVVPGWYIPAEHQFLEMDRAMYPQGNFNCGLAHGIPGPLVLMAASMRAGVVVPGQQDAMEKIAGWLLEWRHYDEHGAFWPGRIGLQEWREGRVEAAKDRGAWCYGTPGVARALFLAGEALGRADWKQAALEAFHAVFGRLERLKIEAPMFCHGLVGLLQVAQRMVRDSGDGALLSWRDELARRVADLYDPETPYGFYDLAQQGEHVVRAHKPGLLEGAAGAALVLLGLLHEEEQEWDAIFMLS